MGSLRLGIGPMQILCLHSTTEAQKKCRHMSWSIFLHRIWHDHEILCDKKCRLFFFHWNNKYPIKAGGNKCTLWSFSLRSFLQYSATSSSKYISRHILEYPEPIFYSLQLPDQVSHRARLCCELYVLRQQRERWNPSEPNCSRRSPNLTSS
jgi:hypothetical protein